MHRNNNVKFFFSKAHMSMLLLLISVTFSLNSHADWQKTDYSTMGTNILVEVYHKDAALREQATRAVFAEMERINQQFSTYIDSSELSQLNQNAYKNRVIVSKELFDLLVLSAEISELTQGAFDVTYASVGYLYSYPDKVKPSDEEIQQRLSAIDYRLLELKKDDLSVRYKNPNVKVDLGGVAKGYAVDNAIKILKSLGIEHALVTAGGDTRLLGDRLGKPWIVGIRDPRNRDKQAVLIPLAESAMSTSGDYERYFEENGERFHHIISPKTGKSTHEVQSVSIIGPESVYNDALSTAVFVMGLEKGIGLINGLPEFEAIVMDKQRRMHYSSGLGQ
ncbi:FAD:protein FMN transferase [Glaciecola petra]|uniref:FAD:protein FMN transferase n=1 Tax=Glaciecola petra TaxID=3075602 RepID=A0ABU2ZQU0_9ALTE|nr:FAD:protein FMN transferase [Aestuariibacter sp. P117]MDT0595005.1 FAD:protein FMN transferase [Aestuariibacter sp. P117]